MKITETTVFIFAVYLLILLGATMLNQTYPEYANTIFFVLLEAQLVAYGVAIYLASKKQ